MKFVRYFLLILVFCVSCSTSTQQMNVESKIDYGMVKLSKKQPKAIHVEEKLSSSNVYGPDFADVSNKSTSDTRSKVETESVSEVQYGLFLSNSSFGAVSYISLIRKFEKEKIRFSVYSGRGVGGFIAACLAAGLKSSRIEWLLFKLEKDHLRPLTNQWIDKAIEYLEMMSEKKYLEGFPYVFVRFKNDSPRGKVSGEVTTLSEVFLMDGQNSFESEQKQLSFIKNLGTKKIVCFDCSEQFESSHDKDKVSYNFIENKLALESDYSTIKYLYRYENRAKELIFDLKGWMAIDN